LSEERDLVFFDGACGLCHHSVRFLLREDGAGVLRFAPLQGDTFRAEVPAERRAGLPDSLVVRTADGRLLTRSDATIHLLHRLGGRWRRRAAWLARVPRPIRDAAYRLVAFVRRRFFRRPQEVCPVVAPPLRARFLS
jgi:predicted DCC family thiol-disulfide oxidoreductase YuxK